MVLVTLLSQTWHLNLSNQEIYESRSDAKEQQQPPHSTRIQGAPKDAHCPRSDDACFLWVRYYHLLWTVTLFGFFLKKKTKIIKNLWLSQQNQEQDKDQYSKVLPEVAARNQRMTAAGQLIPLCWSLIQFQWILLFPRLQSWIRSDVHLQV